MSHFSAIGLTVASEDEFACVVADLLRRAKPAGPDSKPDRQALFTDPSGAAVAFHFDESGSVVCVTPFFAAPAGTTRWKVQTHESHIDLTCSHCSGADCDVVNRASGDVVTRTTVQWLFFEPYRAWLRSRRVFELELVGFASHLRLCQSNADLKRARHELFGSLQAEQTDASLRLPAALECPELESDFGSQNSLRTVGQDPSGGMHGAALDQPRSSARLRTPLRLSEEAFLPYGMFDNDGDVGARARVLLTGKVLSVSQPKNRLTTQSFAYVRVSTLGGNLDLVAPADVLEGAPKRPMLVIADAWLVGNPSIALTT